MNENIWGCAIGGLSETELPPDANVLIRNAVQAAYKQITGHYAEFCFSGFGHETTTGQQEVIDAGRESLGISVIKDISEGKTCSNSHQIEYNQWLES